MTDPGLNQRLRQRSRRSGLMIGFSMLLTLVVCVASFTMIYARLEPVVSDFVGRGDIEVPTPVPTAEPVAEAPEPTAPPEDTAPETEGEDAPPVEEEEAPPEDGGDNQIEEVADEDPEGFTPDYQIESNQSVNLRPGPGVASGDAIVALPIAAPLMFMGEEQETQDPERDLMESGQVWMLFQTEDGTEGWVRELDITEYEP